MFVETPETFAANVTEVKVCQRIEKLYRKLSYMEEFKNVKPNYSQACDRLYTRIVDLLMPNGELNANIEVTPINSTKNQQQQNAYLKESQLSAKLRWKD